MIKKLFSAIFFVGVSASAIAAQLSPEQAINKARDDFSNIKNRSIELERMKRETSKRPVSENLTLRFPMIKEDFEEIQKINGDRLRGALGKTPVNYKIVVKHVSEINHRAERLRENLFAEETNEKNETKNESQTLEKQEIKTLFAALDESINSFVHNQIFQNINLVNPDDSLRAQQDLEKIISLSRAIKLQTKN